jgi:RHS repeat-associated protein
MLPSRNIVARFVYASDRNTPSMLIKDGETYRIISDHTGSPRLIIHAGTGAIMQQLDYDEYGNVTNDTNPGFQPFGFMGGLLDRDTGLVTVGPSSYDAEVGRTTAKDPTSFAAGDTNLSGSVVNDPVNLSDSGGLGWGDWHCVTATLEGTTADGLNPSTAYGLNTDTDLFAALPNEGMRGREIDVMANGTTVRTVVGDVGPWNGGHSRNGTSFNDPYWDDNSRPQAECGTDLRGRQTNGAGIDLSEALAERLGIRGTTQVCWRGRP